MYILNGGYSQYYSQSAMFSEPRGYVRMDDPQFARDRRQDMDQFRTKSRFSRTRSYAFGESNKGSGGMGRTMERTMSQAPSAASSGSSAHQRNAASLGGASAGSSMFSAPSCGMALGMGMSMGMRSGGGLGLGTLDEDANASMASDADDSFAMDGVDKSPCPPPTAKTSLMFAGGGRLGGARRMQRAQTYSAIR